jgi:primosomal protein N' (replication factor Y)
MQRGEQSLLYLNRRGTARVILCNHCGWQAVCPHCDLPLTYHHDVHQLQCHTCGYHSGVRLRARNAATPKSSSKSSAPKPSRKKLPGLFPEARAMRFDTDNKTSRAF